MQALDVTQVGSQTGEQPEQQQGQEFPGIVISLIPKGLDLWKVQRSSVPEQDLNQPIPPKQGIQCKFHIPNHGVNRKTSLYRN